MFPMIVNADEVRQAKELLKESRSELEEEGQEFGSVDVGVMVETPAAAICAAGLAKEVAFFSVGTNDLVQYTLAADRGNERLRHLQHADHPAVLNLIGLTCDAAEEAGIWVGVCGEAAAGPGPRTEAHRAGGQGALHERAVYPESEKGGVRDLVEV